MDRLDREVQGLLEELRSLRDLMSEGESALFRFLCQRCVAKGLATFAWVGIAEDTPEKTVRVVASWPPEHPYLQQITVRWSRDPEGEGPTGRALRTGAPQISPSIEADFRMAPWQEAALRYGFRSSAALPFDLPDGEKAVLNLYHRMEGAYVSLLPSLEQVRSLLVEVGAQCQLIQHGRQTERAFRITAQRLSHLLDVMQEVFYIVEYPQRKPPGVVVYVSPNVETILGVEPGHFMQDPLFWFGLLHPEDRMKVQLSMERLLQSEEPQVRRYRLRHPKNGTYLWVEDRSRAEWDETTGTLRVYGVARDITEEQASQAKAAEHEHLFLAMAEDASVGIFILLLDTPPMFAYMNPFLRRLLGFPDHGPVLWEEVQERLSPETRDNLQRQVDRLLTGEAPVIRETFEIHGGAGRVWHLDLVARRVWVRKRPAIVGIVEDTTQIAQLETQIQQAQKMEVVGRMAAGIAHDFNNLLTLILGHLDLALMDLPENAQTLKEDLETARNAGHRATQLTRQLMLLGAPGPGERVPVSWNRLIMQVEPILRSALGDRIQLVLDLQKDLQIIEGDPSQLEQVLMNLVINARDAMPEGGTLTLETRNLVRTDVSEAHASSHVPFVRVRVMDTGMGMDEETRSRLFEPFFTTKPRGKGTGLGLSTVYRIVQIHRGWIEVDSTPGKGTVFSLYFPTTSGHATAEPAIVQERVPHAVAETPLNVLLVEDDPRVAGLLKRYLERKGYRVWVASTLKEGEQLLRQHHPDLLITDVELPDGNGASFVLRNLRDPAFPPTVVMSGFIQEEQYIQEIQHMGIPFLQKPFPPGKLLGIIEQIRQTRSTQPPPRDPPSENPMEDG